MKLPIKHDRLNRTINRAAVKFEKLLVLLRKYFLTGVLVLVPMAVTVYIMYIVFQLTDGLLGVAVARAIGYRIPGMGLFLTASICIIAGMIAQNYFGRRILSGIEVSLEKIPVVRSLYNGIKQVADVIVQKNRGEFKRVVMVEYPKENSWTLGFVTADFTVPLKSEQMAERKMATVFIPTTPNPTSGFLLIIEKSRIIDTHMDIEEAMKVVISGGLVQPGKAPEATEELAVEDFSIPH
ncbi:MAG: DUF502 domain-containing protein [Candidatus Rifleibacteriota bacterium]